jgi:hypothetical protein
MGKYFKISPQNSLKFIIKKYECSINSQRPSWSYDSWIYNYLCIQCLSPLKLWVWTQLRRGELDTTLCDKVCQWLATGWWFSPGSPVSSTNKTDHHDKTEILLKVVLNTITLTLTQIVNLQMVTTMINFNLSLKQVGFSVIAELMK